MMGREDLFYLSKERETAELRAWATNREAEERQAENQGVVQYSEPLGPEAPQKKKPGLLSRAASAAGGRPSSINLSVAAAAQGVGQIMDGAAKALLFRPPKTARALDEWDEKMQAVKQVVDGVFGVVLSPVAGISHSVQELIGDPARMEQPLLDPLFSGFIRTVMGGGDQRTPEAARQTNTPMTVGETIDFAVGLLGIGAHVAYKVARPSGAPAKAGAPAEKAAAAAEGPKALPGATIEQKALPPAPGPVVAREGGAIPQPGMVALTPQQSFVVMNRMRLDGTLQPFMEMVQARAEATAQRAEVQRQRAGERKPFEEPAAKVEGKPPAAEPGQILDAQGRPAPPAGEPTMTGRERERVLGRTPIGEPARAGAGGAGEVPAEAAPGALRSRAEILAERYPPELLDIADHAEQAVIEVMAGWERRAAGLRTEEGRTQRARGMEAEDRAWLERVRKDPETAGPPPIDVELREAGDFFTGLAKEEQRAQSVRFTSEAYAEALKLPGMNPAAVDVLGLMVNELREAQAGRRVPVTERIEGKGKVQRTIAELSTYPEYIDQLGYPRTRAGADRLAAQIEKVLEGKADPEKVAPIIDYANQQIPKYLGEQGSANTELLARMAMGALIGGATGDTAEESVRNGLIGMGLGAMLSGRLARAVVNRLSRPGVLEGAGPTFYSGVPLPNFERILSSARVKTYLESLYQSAEFQIMGTEARRGVQKLTTTEKMGRDVLAKEGVGKFARRLVEAEPGAIFNAEELTAARLVEQAAANQVMIVADRITAGTARPGESIRAALATSNAISLKVQALRAESARSTGAMRIPVGEDLPFRVDPERLGMQSRLIAPEMTEAQIAQKIQELKVPDAAETTMRVQQLAREVQAAPNAFMTIWYGVRMLSSPLTHVKNTVGSALSIPWTIGVRTVGAVVSNLNPLHDPAQPRVAFGEPAATAIAALKSIPDAWRLAGEARVSGERISPQYGTSEGLGKFAESQLAASRQEFGARAQALAETPFLGTMFRYLHKYATFNLNMLVAEDQFLETIIYNSEKAALAVRHADARNLTGDAYVRAVAEQVKQPSPEVVKAAWARAQEDTLNKPAEYGTALASFMNLTDSNLSKLLLLPFRMVPARMAEYGMVNTPGLNLLAKQFYSDMGAGGATAELAVSKVAMGTGAVTAAWWMAANGLITGSPPKDNAQRQRAESAGKKWHSFKVGSYSIPMDYLGPGAIPLTMAADMAQVLADAPSNVPWESMAAQYLAAATWGAVNAMSQYSFLQTLKDVQEAVFDPAGPSAARFIKNRLNVVPAVVSFGRRLYDPIQREQQGVIDLWASQVPGWAEDLPARLDAVSGKPKTPAIFATEEVTDDPVALELARLKGAGIADPPYWISGQKPPFESPAQLKPARPEDGVPITAKQHARLVELQTSLRIGKRTLHEALSDTIASKTYKNQSDGLPGPGGDIIVTPHSGKAGLLQDVYHAYNQQARDTLLKEDKPLAAAVATKQGERILQRVPTAQQPKMGQVIQRLVESIGR